MAGCIDCGSVKEHPRNRRCDSCAARARVGISTCACGRTKYSYVRLCEDCYTAERHERMTCHRCGERMSRPTARVCRACYEDEPPTITDAQRAAMSAAASKRHGRTPERDELIRQLAAEGLKGRDIAARVGTSQSTVSVILRHGGWTARARGEKL